MKRIAALLIVTSLVSAPLAAQDASNAFEGTWTMDTSRSASSAPGQDAPVRHASQVIRTLGRELTIEFTRDDQQVLVRYPMSSAEQPEPIGTSGSYVGVGTIVRWEGGELVTSTPVQISGKTMTVFERRYLNADGNEMTIEKSIRIEHGYQGDGRSDSDVVKDVYLRTR
jgi:hypothetical protein